MPRKANSPTTPELSPPMRTRLNSESSLTGYLTCSDNEHDYNEKIVDDINISFFYQPRTLTLLFFVISSLVLFALFRDDSVSRQENIFHGFLSILILFVPISLLCLPNGPFIRPHPAVWRIVCGYSIAYQLCLSFAVFQRMEDVRGFLVTLYPDLAVASNDSMKAYAENCDLTAHNLWMSIDFFTFSHFVGYIAKAMLIRNAGLLWFLSVMWEVTELAFMDLLPNFAECWWDMLILDILLCNGLGIYVGMRISRHLEMSSFHWESIKDIRTASGKIRRIILQFTPESWKQPRWSAASPPVRVLAILILVFIFQMYELNFFVFKHIYHIPSSHPMLLTHHFFLLMSSAPAARQYYMYVTDRNRKRIGAHFWFYVANMATESLLNYRHGKDFLDTLNPTKVLMWVTIQILLSIAVVVSMVWFTTEKSKGRLSFSGSALSARQNHKERHVDFRDGQDVCDDTGHHHHITVAASDEGDHDADAEGEDETAKVVMARQRRKR
ncbi:phosphatidylserine synthase 1-like [Sycon ciliatum]|uniref:phosphatidylserine synthase 1-like n=1 Tax=Sycon ciliatum TaxID=27933 RepID=UPI0031F6BE8E